MPIVASPDDWRYSFVFGSTTVPTQHHDQRLHQRPRAEQDADPPAAGGRPGGASVSHETLPTRRRRSGTPRPRGPALRHARAGTGDVGGLCGASGPKRCLMCPERRRARCRHAATAAERLATAADWQRPASGFRQGTGAAIPRLPAHSTQAHCFPNAISLCSTCMKDDTAPATKADLRTLAKSLTHEIATSRKEHAVEFDHLRRELKGDINSSNRETGVEFEKLRDDVLGALREIQSLVKDKSTDYEQRIRRLEHVTGVARHPVR